MADLEARMMEALRGLYLLSNGTTMKIDANRVTHSKDPSRPPSGDSYPLVDEFSLRWARASSPKARLEVVKAAEQALSDVRRRPDPLDREVERGSLAWKRRIANDKRPVAEVCRVYTVSRFQVAGLIAQYREDAA